MDRVDESTIVNNENDNGGEEAQSTFKETMISAIQVNKQLQVIKGYHSEGTQTASNCIAVVNGANACRHMAAAIGMLYAITDSVENEISNNNIQTTWHLYNTTRVRKRLYIIRYSI